LKRVISSFFALMFIINLMGCGETNRDDTSSVISIKNDSSNAERDAYYNTFYNFESKFTDISVQNNNYIIKTSDKHAGEFYEIYDNYDNLLDKGYHDWRGSFDISKEKNIVTLKYGFGGTSVHPKYRLYDVEKGKVSRYFDGPIAVFDNLIAYVVAKEEKGILIVQDIFDTDKYYQEFYGKFNRFIYMKVIGLSFSADGTKVMIKHHEDKNESNIIEEVFEIE